MYYKLTPNSSGRCIHRIPRSQTVYISRAREHTSAHRAHRKLNRPRQWLSASTDGVYITGTRAHTQGTEPRVGARRASEGRRHCDPPVRKARRRRKRPQASPPGPWYVSLGYPACITVSSIYISCYISRCIPIYPAISHYILYIPLCLIYSIISHHILP